MTNDPVQSIEPWLGALREDVEPMTDSARCRIASRLASTALVVAAGVAAPAAAGLSRRGLLQSRLFAAALALPAGALLGALGHAHWDRRAAPPVMASTASRVSAAMAPPSSVASIAAPPTAAMPAVPLEATPAVPSSPKRVAAVPPSVNAEQEAPSLERELSLLERARTALSEGEPQNTLRLLVEHRRAYPASSLQQEREALAIRALMAVGRVAEARARAARFAAAYPTSPLRSSVDRALAEAIP